MPSVLFLHLFQGVLDQGKLPLITKPPDGAPSSLWLATVSANAIPRTSAARRINILLRLPNPEMLDIQRIIAARGVAYVTTTAEGVQGKKRNLLHPPSPTPHASTPLRVVEWHRGRDRHSVYVALD
jgi:hypothetical protein